RGAVAAGSGRHAREAGCTAKTTVATRSTTPPAASAAPVDHSAPSPSATGGPAIQVSSEADASAAYVSRSATGSPAKPGYSAHTHASTGGGAGPKAPPGGAMKAAGAPTGGEAEGAGGGAGRAGPAL